ncbi:site-specific integrase [Desulfuromonas sp. AOP6]|uniref:site-specific integrase n=1 Tax=Desulfuromonas sp. AOP6 TaxID=1566351 RepID=UPI001283E512|nr:site-specific integrase [Desulfuromonas sp. AOP6]BCA79063.1 integrase [Desulfuromonas sp. AOP6]
MATITQRDSGWWQAKVRRKGQSPISQTFEFKEDAIKWARAIEREIDTQTFVSDNTAQRTTVKEVLIRYRDEVLPQLAGGAKPDRSRISRLIDCLGDINLAALDSSHISQYRDKRLLKENAAPQTVKHELGLLNRVLKQCVIDWGIHLPRGIATTNVRKPTLPQGRDRRLLSDEEERLLEVAKKSKSKEIEHIIVIAIETAARRGEIAAMTWKDIDLKKRTWHIPKTKTGVPRTVPLSRRAVATLKSLPRRIDGKVWALKRDDSITQAFERLCKRKRKINGMNITEELFPNLNFHDLRHEGTSRFFERGFNIMEVATITGHRDLRVLRRYTHLRAEDLAKKLNDG